MISCKDKTYKNLPLIKAKSIKADYRIGNDWVKGKWTISPHIKFDSLLINCYSNNETFAFYTDLDSISFNLKPEKVHKFYVVLNDSTYALTVVKGKSPSFSTLKFDSTLKSSNLTFWYSSDNGYLKQFRSKYPIDSLVINTKSDTEKAQKIMNWVHQQWEHGNNQPQQRDAISILEEAKEGKKFRCVEYGIVLTTCLNSAGLKARVLGLKTKDVETQKYGAGHVLTEVYLTDIKKWVLVDPQWNAMPILKGIPLNAVEFQKAISENFEELEIKGVSTSKRHYVDWIYPYLHYFDISFDNIEKAEHKSNKVNDKYRLMLVPLNSKNPTIFQGKYPISDCIYTNSLQDFYEQP